MTIQVIIHEGKGEDPTYSFTSWLRRYGGLETLALHGPTGIGYRSWRLQ